MSDIIRIKRNSLFSLISSVIRLVVNFIVFWIIARKYGPVIFGQFTVAQTVAANCIFLADFGFDVLLTTDIAGNRIKAKEYFQKYFSLKILFSFLSIIVMWLIALLSNISYESRILILIFSIYMIFSTLTNFFIAFFKGYEKLEYETLVSLIYNSFLLVFVVMLIIVKADIILISIVFTLTRIIGFFIGLYYTQQLLPGISFKIDLADFRNIKVKVFVFGFHLLFNNLCFQLDTLLLSIWRGDYETGIYQSVFKFLLLALIIPDILSNAVLPTMSRLYVNNIFQWRRIGSILNKILIFAAMVVGSILFIYSDKIISILYGNLQYSESIPILKILTGVMVLRFILEPSALMLTTSKRQHIRMLIVIFATILNIVLNYFFINRYGAYGAAIVSLITNFFMCCAYLLSTINIMLKWFVDVKIIVLLIISLAIVVIFNNVLNIDIYFGVPLVLIAFIALGYFHYFSLEERKKIFTPDFGFTFIKKI